jgi:hypothetical protein
MSNNDGPSAADRIVFEREVRKWEKKKSDAEKLKDGFRKGFTELLASQEGKHELAKAALVSTQSQKSGADTTLRNFLKSRDSEGRIGFTDFENDVITGREAVCREYSFAHGEGPEDEE